MDDTSDLPGIARQQCAAAVANGYEAVRAASAKWWQQFWTRSYVDLHSEDGRAAAVPMSSLSSQASRRASSSHQNW